jgi:hypothetical protein
MQAQAATGLGGDVNILEAMEMFKSVPDQVLPKYAQDPKLAIFAAAEMARRDDMRKRYQQRAQKPNKPVVAQLAESLAPSMPAMPPGMNAPQQQPQMQMAPSQMQPQMQQQMQPQMQPQMQEPQQPGIASLMPQQSFAGGGPVAFKDGGVLRFNSGLQVPGVSQEFGGDGSYLTEEELEAIRRQARKENFPEPLIGRVGLSEVKDIREGRLTPQEIATKVAVKTGSPLPPRQEQQAPVNKPTAPLAQPTQAPTNAPMGISSLIEAGKKAMGQLGVQPVQVPEPYETAGRADQLYKERQGRFPDQISPIMQQLKDFYSKQPTQADIDKAANRQIALSMMGSKERNFLAGLAGGLQAGEDVKKSMGAENRAMQQASLQAQLAHAKYQDAIRRGDYDAADKAAREERAYSLQVQQLRQEQAMMPLNLGIMAARAQPRPAAGEKPLDTKSRIELQMKVQALAEPKLQQLKKEWSSKWIKPSNWEQDPEYLAQRQAIIRRTYEENAPQLMGPETVSDQEMRQRLGR